MSINLTLSPSLPTNAAQTLDWFTNENNQTDYLTTVEVIDCLLICDVWGTSSLVVIYEII